MRVSPHPGLDHVALGVSLPVVGVLEWAIITAVTVAHVRRQAAQPWSLNLTRVLGGQIATVPVVLAGLLLSIKVSGSLY